jgi:hypothetical protein
MRKIIYPFSPDTLPGRSFAEDQTKVKILILQGGRDFVPRPRHDGVFLSTGPAFR